MISIISKVVLCTFGISKISFSKPPKPIPKTKFSERFEGLEATIDTGMTVPKLIEALKNKLPKDEIFRRIRPRRLVELLALHAFAMQEQERMERIQLEEETVDKPVPSYHHMHSSIVFNDDGPVEPIRTRSMTQIECPFLLLDVRDEEAYENCRIQGAKHYPKARLSRATGQFTSEVLSFRGNPEKLIVLYCDYGKISGEAAQMFAERDFDNIFLLHGGLAEFAEQYPNLVGPNNPPVPLTPSKKSTAMSSAASKVSNANVRGLNPHLTKRDPNSKKPWR